MKQEPDSIQKLVVLIKFVFSTLTDRADRCIDGLHLNILLKTRAENHFLHCGNFMENRHLHCGKALSLTQLGVYLRVSVSVHMNLCVNTFVFAYIYSS